MGRTGGFAAARVNGSLVVQLSASHVTYRRDALKVADSLAAEMAGINLSGHDVTGTFEDAWVEEHGAQAPAPVTQEHFDAWWVCLGQQLSLVLLCFLSRAAFLQVQGAASQPPPRRYHVSIHATHAQ